MIIQEGYMYDILCFKSQHTGTTGLEHALFCPGCSPSVTPTFHLDGFAEKKKLLFKYASS